jgi:hypothetical protein
LAVAAANPWFRLDPVGPARKIQYSVEKNRLIRREVSQLSRPAGNPQNIHRNLQKLLPDPLRNAVGRVVLYRSRREVDSLRG